MILLILALLSSPALGLDNKYFATKKVTYTVIERNSLTDSSIPKSSTPMPLTPMIPGGTGDSLDILDSINKIWIIVENNKPVVNMDSPTYATALPLVSQNNWNTLSNWKPEHNYTYRIEYLNYYNMKTVIIEYQVKVIYGGDYNGIGKYIASARIVPTTVKVLWGYNLDIKITAPIVFNTSTSENPVAAIQMNVVYKVKTVLNDETNTDTYQVQGDGKIIDTKNNLVLVNSGFEDSKPFKKSKWNDR